MTYRCGPPIRGLEDAGTWPDTPDDPFQVQYIKSEQFCLLSDFAQTGSNRLSGERSHTEGGVTPPMEGRLCGACQHHPWRKSGVSQASARTRVSSVRAGGCGPRADIA